MKQFRLPREGGCLLVQGASALLEQPKLRAAGETEEPFAISRTRRSIGGLLVLLLTLVGSLSLEATGYPLAAGPLQQQSPTQPMKPEALDELVAPIALYPDALIAQILMCATSPYQITHLSAWMKKSPTLAGSDVQAAAQQEGFDPSFVALALFPQVVDMMADQIDWTRQLNQALSSDRKGLFDSLQRLRFEAMALGNLQTTPQQEVKTETTESGQQVIVIQPANPQVVYVPQYNPQIVYTQPAPTTVIIIEEDDHSDAVWAGVIGFTAGVIVGASANNHYWGPYGWGWYGGAYMYAEAWDDFYDYRENIAEDYFEHREEITETRQENRTERQENRTENRGDRQDNRTERQGNRQDSQTQRQTDRETNRAERQDSRGGTSAERQTNRQDTQSQRQGSRDTSRTERQGQRSSSISSNYGSRGYGDRSGKASRERTGTRSGGFSGYGNGRTTRSTSSRGRSSMGSRSTGGGRGRR